MNKITRHIISHFLGAREFGGRTYFGVGCFFKQGAAACLHEYGYRKMIAAKVVLDFLG